MEHAKQRQNSLAFVLLLPVTLIALGAGFFGGITYQRSKANSTTTQSMRQDSNQQGFGNFGGGNGNRMGGIRGGFGEVTAVTDTSVTIKNSFNGELTTYTISGSTKITDNNATASVSDIKVGTNIMVQTSSTDSKAATEIRLNVQMPSRPQGGTDQSNNPDMQLN